MKNLVRERFDLAKNKMCSMNQKLATGLATAATMFGVPVNVYADTESKLQQHREDPTSLKIL